MVRRLTVLAFLSSFLALAACESNPLNSGAPRAEYHGALDDNGEATIVLPREADTPSLRGMVSYTYQHPDGGWNSIMVTTDTGVGPHFVNFRRSDPPVLQLRGYATMQYTAWVWW